MYQLGKRRFSSSVVWVSCFAIIGCCFNYLLNVFFARHLSPALYGDLSLARHCLIVVTTLTLFGTHSAAQRFVPALDSMGEASFLRWVASVLKRAWLGLLFILVPIYCIFFVLHDLGVKSLHSYHMSALLLLASPVCAVFLILNAFLKSKGHVVVSQGIESIAQYLILVLFAVGAVYFTDSVLHMPALVVVFVLAYSFLVMCITPYYLSMSHESHRFFPFSRGEKTGAAPSGQWRQFSMRMTLNGVMFLLIGFVDLLTLELFPHGEHLVGYFSVCMTIVGFYSLVARVYLRVIKPQVNLLLQTQAGQKKLQGLYLSAFRFASILVLLITVGIVVFHEALLGSFGAEYLVVADVLFILALSAILDFLMTAPAMFLIYGGHEGFVMRLNSARLLILLVVCPVFTYFYSMKGAAMADLVVCCVISFFLYLKYRMHFTIKVF